MLVFAQIKEWQNLRRSVAFGTSTLGFVPTMGALHEGHLSLVGQSKKENDKTLVSIFVNPTQFNDPNDYQKYPKTLAEDLKMLEEAGVDYVFLPDEKQMYPDGYKYQVSETEMSKALCGAHRPGHFQGMLTVVLKLLQIADAEQAYFGEKDYQQYLLIKGMAEAFFLKTHIVPCPTVRESDGLALSSRNRRLSAEERARAPLFAKALRQNIAASEAIKSLDHEGFTVEYIEERAGRRFGAVRLGETRLIDNVEI